jgi:hypothetical protein
MKEELRDVENWRQVVQYVTRRLDELDLFSYRYLRITSLKFMRSWEWCRDAEWNLSITAAGFFVLKI